MIVIVDYRCGNLGSIVNMLRRIGEPALVSARPQDIAQADKLVLPGVGAFDHGMQSLKSLGLIPVLEEQVFGHRKPLLGICLGMQLLTHGSEEGSLPGLGWIDAATLRFQVEAAHGLRVPHMGWNSVTWRSSSHPLAEGLDAARFYFVHSYHVACRSEDSVLATACYGSPFHAAVVRDNIAGTQFHPEKSHRFGMRLLANFVRHTHVSRSTDSLPAAARRRAG